MIVPGFGYSHFQGQQVIGAESRLDPGELVDGADEEAGADEKRRGDRHLGHEEAATHGGAAPRSTASFLQRVARSCPSVDERGNGAENPRREKRQQKTVAENLAVQPDVLKPWDVRGEEVLQRREPGEGEADSERSAEQCEEHRFGETSGGETPPSRSEGGLNGRFPAAAHPPREKKIGDVGAGDEEHEAHRPHEQLERALVVLDALVGEALHRDRESGVGGGVLGLELSRNRLHLRLGLLERDAVAQPTEHIDALMVSAVVRRLVVAEGIERDVRPLFRRELEVSR